MAGWDGVELRAVPAGADRRRPGLRRQRRQRDGAAPSGAGTSSGTATCCSSRRRPASGVGIVAGRPGAARRARGGRRDRAHQDLVGRGAALPLRRHRLRRGGRRRLGAGAVGARSAATRSAHVRDLVAAGGRRRRRGRGTWSARPAAGSARRWPSAVNLLNPEAVVVGGDLAAGLRHVRRRAARVASTPRPRALATRELQIVPVTHGEQSGVVGCAAMAIREVLDSAAVDRALAAPRA